MNGPTTVSGSVRPHFHRLDEESARAGATVDPVSLDIDPCGTCCGAGAVCEEYEPGEGVTLVPAWDYESGQRPCPECGGAS